MYLYLYCVVFGETGDKNELAWGGKSDNVTAGQGSHLYLGSGACRTTLYIQIYLETFT